MKTKKKSDFIETISLIRNASDLNWMYSGRLRVRAAAGDEEAKKELEELENTPVDFFVVSPDVEPEEKQDQVLSGPGPIRMCEELPSDEIVEPDSESNIE